MKHWLLVAALTLMACGDRFVPFDDDELAAGGAGGATTSAGAGAGGTGGDAVGAGASGGATTGGAGGEGGGTPRCAAGDRLCDGDWLQECEEGQWVHTVDCTVAHDACIAGRCELDLVLLFRFEEGQGTEVTDDGATGYVGTVSQSTWVAGAVDGGLEIADGGDIALGNVLNSLSLPLTMAAWIRISSAATENMTLLALDTSAATNYAGAWLALDGSNGNSLSAWFGNATSVGPSGRNGRESGVVINSGTWTHVGAVLRGQNDVSLFIGGIDVGGSYSGTAASMAFTAAPALVGVSHWAGADLQYEGGIDELRIYSRALDGAEMAALAAL